MSEPKAWKAILIDGVGRSREMTLHERLRSVRIPTPRAIDQAMMRPSSDPPAFSPMPFAEFDYLGELPNGVLVYGFHFERRAFLLWRFVIDHAIESFTGKDSSTGGAHEPLRALHVKRVREEIDRQFDREILALSDIGPIVRLYDAEDEDGPRAMYHRVVMGASRAPA
jgi:hypothetical protein